MTTTLARSLRYDGVGGLAGLLNDGSPNTLEDTFTRTDQTGWATSTNSDGVSNAAWGLDGSGSLSYVTITNNLGVFGYQGSKNVIRIAPFRQHDARRRRWAPRRATRRPRCSAMVRLNG